jgi:aminoglycoside N3'-acetyltransferase
MKSSSLKYPCKKDLAESFASVGLEDGSIVYLSTQLYGIGPLRDALSRREYLAAIYAALHSVIGHKGTLVVPTFTQQVGRFGLPFILEETVSLTGIFGEYVRSRPDSVRSLHPVFSVAAIGFRAHEICDNISTAAFGIDSAFDRMVRMGTTAVCMGFDYYSGHIVSLAHLVETAYAVPYYYNKLVYSPVFSNGVQVEKPFIINVKYLDINCCFDFKKYIDTLDRSNMIRSSAIGRGEIHAVDSRVMFDTGISLLKEDIYSFLSNPPQFHKGEIPMDGPMNFGGTFKNINSAGFHLEQL